MGNQVTPLPIVLNVQFTINTPDRLKQITFGLEKQTDDVAVNWTITFILYERNAPHLPFGDAIVNLSVFVASKLNQQAQAVADANGLTPEQTAHAIGPAAEAAKAAQAGTMPQPVADNIIQNTLK
jgi:hypothetical protein